MNSETSMWMVVFRARVKTIDSDYQATAMTLRDLALSQYGCLDFVSALRPDVQGDEEIAISYWASEEDLLAWKQDPQHLAAQQLGRERWYESYSVSIAPIARHYGPLDESS